MFPKPMQPQSLKVSNPEFEGEVGGASPENDFRWLNISHCGAHCWFAGAVTADASGKKRATADALAGPGKSSDITAGVEDEPPAKRRTVYKVGVCVYHGHKAILQAQSIMRLSQPATGGGGQQQGVQ